MALFLIDIRSTSRLKLGPLLPKLNSDIAGSLFKLGIISEKVVFVFRAIAMRIFSRESFKEEIILNTIICCELMFIVVTILQAKPNDGFLQTRTSQSKYDKI